MTEMYVQVKTNYAGPRVKFIWKKCNPIKLGYQNKSQKITKPYLALVMQLGSIQTEKLNNIQFGKQNSSEKCQLSMNARGINNNNFPCLKPYEAQALHDLAFADFTFAEKLAQKSLQQERNIYESIVKFDFMDD